MNIKHRISTIDSHTAGEPTRIIVDGFGHIRGRTMADRMDYLRTRMDWLRKSLICEPRGHRDMFGAVLLPPLESGADAAVVYMDSERYLSMCGHGTLGISAMLVETGRVPSVPGENVLRLETPAGVVSATVRTDAHGKIGQVRLEDVPSFAWAVDEVIAHPTLGEIRVDIAYGGNFFVLVDAAELGIESVHPEQLDTLIKTGISIREAANQQISVQHPVHSHIRAIDLCMVTLPATTGDAHARNIVIFGSGQVDRSPCGTGTCARMAVLHRKGQLAVGRPFRHEGILGTVFDGVILHETVVGEYPAIVPEISCRPRPFITGFHDFIIDPEDPFGEGFELLSGSTR